MGKVVWNTDNDRKLLIRLIDKSAKSYNSEALSQLFEGATPKAIEERIAKLKREAKALDHKCITPPSSPHKPKGNFYTATPIPGRPYQFKRTFTEAMEDDEGKRKRKSTKMASGAKRGRKKKVKTEASIPQASSPSSDVENDIVSSENIVMDSTLEVA